MAPFLGVPRRIEHYVTTSTLSTTRPSAPAQGDMIATAINLSGNLCAVVQSVVPLQVGGGDKVFEVECVEYRGGRGTVRYIVDTRSGTVSQAR
jgi:hypothetical protein